MRITKVYTRTGDEGSTSLAKGERVSKDDPRITAIGSLDETNSVIGAALAEGVVSEIAEVLEGVQHTLFNIGGALAMKGEDHTLVREEHVSSLEAFLDGLNSSLPPLKEFVLPGGSKAGSHLHHARAVCRRAERDVVTLHKEEPIDSQILAYLNRLSDYLFVAARYQNVMDGGNEEMWKR